MGQVIRTVERRVHATEIDEQTHHCHVLRRFVLGQQLVSQDLARLATPGHRVDIEIGKGLLRDLIRLIAVCEDGPVVLKHCLEKLILDVLPPERLSVVLLKMLYLVATVH
jgi:hypothetical protein